MQELIFGKNPTPRIVGCEIDNDLIELFTETNEGITSQFLKNTYWLLCPRKLDWGFKPLQGNLWFKFMKTYSNASDYYKDRKKYKKEDLFYVSDQKEAAMIFNGFTYFKDMKINDVSVLGFDIESSGLQHNNSSRVFLISNTYRKGDLIIRKMFSCDEYNSDAEMFKDWCQWVREVDPSVMLGHNIYGYDIPYLKYCAEKVGVTLDLGRNGSAVKINDYPSTFRKDGSQEYEYKRSYIYGREIVDTMFVAYHFDFARKYTSYALKQIIKEENLEIEGRQFYDASKISQDWNDLEKRQQIKLYAEHDADDAIALYDLMIPAYFYLNQSVPKSFAAINYTASGSQINAFLVRSYLQDGHSIPKVTEVAHFEGATSFGNPGRYKNVFKIDVASLYPSIMLEYKVFDKKKDPLGNFQKMVSYFTEERLNNKKLAKETGDRYYKEVQEAQKIIINSAYGMMGAPGLQFNSPDNAAFVTRTGREVLQKAIDWTQQYDFFVVNADTDSISICFEDMGEIIESDRQRILDEINALFPERIKWEDDGYYPSVLVLKAKNYVLFDGVKKKIKGSALKATNKELALKEFIKKAVDNLLVDNIDGVKEEYDNLAVEIHNLKDINRWVSKKTITEAVLNPERTNEQKVNDIIDEDEVQMGDKIYVYFKDDETNSLGLAEKWQNDHSKSHLTNKLFKTIKIFENVLNLTHFPNYSLKRKSKQLLEELLSCKVS